MDFVNWCDHVLNKIVEASTSTEALFRGYLTDDLLAQNLFGEQTAPLFQGSPQRTRLHSALDELAASHLVRKTPVGQNYRVDVTSLGRKLQVNTSSLWKEIAALELSDEAERLLQLINGLSQHSDENMVWVEAVDRERLLQLGWDNEDMRMRAIRELEHHGFVHSFPPLGSSLALTATYRGIVWETRRAPEDAMEPETAHVLFMDIVGYSKLLLDEQTQLRNRLKTIVRGTDTYRTAKARQKVISRSSGDAIALVFSGSPEAPVKCAIEITHHLANDRDLKLRMGIHSGQVRRDEDINDQLDVAGGGINRAQRVMDAGDAGHILVSKRVVDDLRDLGSWSQHLHDLGEIVVKHGEVIHVFNLYGDGFGNPEPLTEHGHAAARSSPLAQPLTSTSQVNIRLALTKEIDINLNSLREIWNTVLDRVRFSSNHPMARMQKSDAIRAIVLPSWRLEKWRHLFSEAVNILTTNEFEKVDRFYSRLERLTELRAGDPGRWRVEGELIISDLVAEGNPLQK